MSFCVQSYQNIEYHTHFNRLCPVRPPPRPPPPSVREKKTRPPPPRPPNPTYYGRIPSAVKPESERSSEGSQQSECSSISSTGQTPDSPDLSEETMNLIGIYNAQVDYKATDRADSPVAPPRLQQSYDCRATLGCEAVLGDEPPPQQKARPPPPSFTPPPPPSVCEEPVYSEIGYPSYLRVLPEDEDQMSRRSTVSSGQYSDIRCNLTRQLTTDDDLLVLLRWMKRMSKSDFMAPSLYGLSIEEEVRSFNQRSVNVTKALRLYNLLMIKRKECLQNIITEFKVIVDNLDKIKKKNKTMGIAGGTTGAVGGVTAVLGIALAPVTMGASLIATVIGAGMAATAGGMGAHAAKANKKVVTRSIVEKLAYNYKGDVVDLERCLDYILSGMNELRRHDVARLQRAGAQLDAVKMAHLSQTVFKNNMTDSRGVPVTHTGGATSERLLQAFIKEIDEYFSEKDEQKLRKSCKSRFSGRVALLAKNLQDELDHLNHMWELFS